MSDYTIRVTDTVEIQCINSDDEAFAWLKRHADEMSRGNFAFEGFAAREVVTRMERMWAELAALRSEIERLRGRETELVAACKAAIEYGSHGETDDNVSVSYLLEYASNWGGCRDAARAAPDSTTTKGAE